MSYNVACSSALRWPEAMFARFPTIRQCFQEQQKRAGHADHSYLCRACKEMKANEEDEEKIKGEKT